MNDLQLATTSPSASLLWPTRFAVATWLAAAALVAVFALFWRMAYAPPHGFWALVTTGALLASGALTVVSGVRSILRGQNRLLATAVVMLGTTPIVWYGAYFATLYMKSSAREPISLDTPTRIVGFWAESVGDLEARCRYSRWTTGKHVVLLDNGQTPEAQALVAEMDEHIDEMAANLNAPVPDFQVRWVRGPLLGQTGRALLSWAVCDTQDNSPELTRLDRHEVAHVVIAAMGSVDQEPPMLLAEGWAESQSKDRADLIWDLAWRKDERSTYSLDELIEPEWYGRSYRPVYTHGGPLVIFLMEHYGPEKFLRLYHGVRQDTFRADCERILEDSWAEVEELFWAWLANEVAAMIDAAAASDDSDGAKSKMELAKSVDPADWQAVVTGYRAAWSRRPPLPARGAFTTERISNDRNEGSIEPAKTQVATRSCAIDGDNAWQLDSYQPGGTTFCAIATKEDSITYHVAKDGHVAMSDRRRGGEHVKSEVQDFFEQMTNEADLGHYLPVDAGRDFQPHIRITAIRPPAAGESEWEIEYTSRFPDAPDEQRHKLRCDAAADWCVVSNEVQSADERSESQRRLGTIFGRVTSIDTKRVSINEDGEWKVRFRLREMDEAEIRKARATVNDIARRGSTRGGHDSIAPPLALAIAWPLVGAFLVGAAIIGPKRT